MGFLTPTLLAGAALIAVPVILHLVMRRQPRRVVFPALRFVQARREANRRKVQLRHWLLLAMRCLLVAGLALALARPTLRGSGLRGKAGAPLAATMVFDTSLRMQYVRENKSRLEQAVEIASELIEKLPDETSISVRGLGRGSAALALDRTSALTRLTHLRPSADARPLADAVVEAIEATALEEQRRQEVFVLTDLARQAWNEDATAAIAEALEGAPDVQLYVIDVGVEDPANASLGQLRLGSPVLRPGEPLRVEVAVQPESSGELPLVELQLEDADGMLEKRDQRVATADPSGTLTVSFELADLPLGTQQGRLVLAAADPLAMDNTRYFTVDVRQPARVLLLAASDEQALFVREALAPSLLDRPQRFACVVRPFDQLEASLLEEFDAAFLLDPPPLAESDWEQLLAFSQNGGGLAICLGHRAELGPMNSAAAQRLLPGPLKRQARDETYFRPRRLDHPSLSALADYQETIPWSQCLVFTYWEFADLHADAYIIGRYANGEPALVERLAGRGRVLALTTPLSDPLQPVGREPWNVLPAQPWPFVAICEELAGYLSQDAANRLNYLAGETVRLPLGRRQNVSKYVLRAADGTRQRRTAPPGESALVLSTTDRLGNYRLTAGGEEGLDVGFSVNAPLELSDLTPADAEQLVEAMPAERFEIARTLEDAESYVDVGRSGRELFPWVIMAVTLVWGAEHVLANRFYETRAEA